jgi:hypothetical protein
VLTKALIHSRMARRLTRPRASLRGYGPAWLHTPARRRDYLNAPVDSWLLNYNAGYMTSVMPEDGADLIPGVRANVLSQ